VAHITPRAGSNISKCKNKGVQATPVFLNTQEKFKTQVIDLIEFNKLG